MSENEHSTHVIGQCEMPECDSTEDLKLCSDPSNQELIMCASCRSEWPVTVVETDGGVLSREWPECIRCGSEETTVVPKTGEWTCQDCGCQWTADETPADDADADKIPEDISHMVEELVRTLNTATDRDGGQR